MLLNDRKKGQETGVKFSRSTDKRKNASFKIMGIGLKVLMAIAGIALVTKFNTGQTTQAKAAYEGVIDYEQSLQREMINEAGVTRIIAELNRPSQKSLLLKSQDPAGLLGCHDSAATPEDECRQWQDGGVNSLPLDNEVGQGSSAGEYRLLAYRFIKGEGGTNSDSNIAQGQLLVEAHLLNKPEQKSRLEVKFPIYLSGNSTNPTIQIGSIKIN